ncbi:MAG: phosphodiester glycosidase family protein [Clostridia bacterium]|nr:phosphodiester glycosidase family protein [Clostridia bacterium]
MKHSPFSKILALLLVSIMLIGVIPTTAFAAKDSYDDSNGGSNYYNLISERSWDIAPGVKEYEQVLNNEGGTRRQVMHAAVVDLNNPYVKVIPGYKGMIPTPGNYGTQSTSTQALEAEKLGYGNVVVATNAMLSWYTEAYYKDHPELIGEPLYYNILDGYYYENSRGSATFNKNYAVLVINYDNHPLTGEPRPADMPKVMMRSQTDPLTGWEQNAICVWAFLVKPDANGNPVSQYPKEDHGSGIASRTFIGIRADGTLVMAVSDGEQAPYSTGFTNYEMADYMIKMGCIYAANCDGGGSTTFCSQRPGEDLKVNCSLSDGGERPTTNTILVVSTAPADGQFARANLSTDYEFYTPGASVTFNALGTDAVGTKVDIPTDVTWQIKEEGMGTIANGVFTSSGKEGTATAQMLYDGKIVGEKSITIVTPDKLFFEQPVVTIPFGKTAQIPVKASAMVNGVAQEIGLGANDVSFTTTNAALGRFDGLNFVAVDEANAPLDVTSTVTATLNMGSNPTATVKLNLGKGSEVLWDFEDGQVDIDEWNVINSRTNDYRDYYLKLSLADRNNGQVHDGDYSLRLEINGLSSKKSDSSEYAWIRLGVDGEAIELENARRVGFWLYVPEDNIQCWVQGHYMTDSNGDGVYDTIATVSMMESENVYYNIDESGWHYMSMDISAYEKIALKYSNQFNKQDSNGQTTGQLAEKGEFFIAIITHRTKNNILWQTNGTINGPYTYYLDSFTVDYSDAVDDRENPIFDKIYLDGTTALVKRDVITTTSNVLNLSAAVAEKMTLADAMGVEQPLYNVSGLDASTAKVYIDGVEVDCTFDGSKITSNGNVVADGYHRVKFEICDKAGNKSVVIRVVEVKSGEAKSTLSLVPADPTLDRIPFGSIYWMDLKATNIETIDSVETVIDLNSVNHWQLDHMYLADGFSAEYSINAETNTATITITRTGDNTQTGEAVLAKLPVRIIYFDTDIKVPGFTAATYWTTYNFFAQDMKMDVDMGLITHTDGSTSTFSNEEFHVDTEMYTTNAAMDKVYFTAHGTTHVHTPVAIEDKAPTCTQPGYTGRTFCAGCNSVVEWGTTVAATGHTFTVDVDNRKIVCACGHEFKGTDLHTIEGKTYYTAAGKLLPGWVGIDDDWYYFDTKTYAGMNGEQYADRGVKFVFDNGRVMTGTWVTTSEGSRYWYGPGYYRDTSPELTSSRPYEINGKTYLFNRQGYMQTGIARFYDATSGGGALATGAFIYYDCGTNGEAVRYTGVYDDYFHIDGIRQKTYMLVQDTDGNFYFINDGHKIAKNVSLYLSEKYVAGHTLADGTPLKAGTYQFDAEGKMVLPEEPPVVEPDEPDVPEEGKNGVIDGYLYINDVKQVRYQLVEYNGDFYFINDGDKVAMNVKLYLSERFVDGKTFPDGRPILPGYYNFDAEGKMIIEALKNGVVGDYLYINDVKQTRYKLVEHDGNFYFINDGDKVAKNMKLYLSETYVSGKTFSDGRAILPGYYNFDAEGKMIIEPLKDGVVGDYLYINDVKQTRYKLVEHKGNFYFINDGDKVAKNMKLYLSETYVSGKTFSDGRAILPGYYNFDAEGKMIVEPVKNGVVGDYLYINDVRQVRYRLVEYDGYFYFINDGDKVAKNMKLYLSERFVEGSPFSAGYYRFDENGKLIVE